MKILKIERFCITAQTITTNPKVFLIPRIRFKFRLPFGQSYQLMRTQFPLRLAYCMSFNKSQGQEFDYYLLDLTEPPFNHGHLYVAFSRVCDASNIAVVINEKQILNKKNCNRKLCVSWVTKTYFILNYDLLFVQFLHTEQ